MVGQPQCAESAKECADVLWRPDIQIGYCLTVPGRKQMRRTVSTLPDFQREWSSGVNFLLARECIDFDYAFPAPDEIVDILRRDEEVRVLRGHRVDRRDIRVEFSQMPIEAAMQECFHLSHFNLSRFYGPGKMLENFEEKVMEPWREFLRRGGFTWERCYPIFFVSGPNSGSHYHVDLSNVLAWQIHGTKLFSGLRNPESFAPVRSIRSKEGRDKLTMPPTLKAEDILEYEMKPGAMLWNHLLTPHWVDATDQPAVSVNISHGMLRYHGELGRNEQLLDDWWKVHPEEAWRVKTA
jgi:hypothetical protein